MVRSHLSCSKTLTRWPCTRGDGPFIHLTGSMPAAAAPHSRGWSLQYLGWIQTGTGCPAPAGMVLDDMIIRQPRIIYGGPATAGMVPKLEPGDVSVLGWPRIHGDGPSACWPGCIFSASASHPRGWSLVEDALSHMEPGDPAPARMVRSSSIPAMAVSWGPRTRGDGPAPRHLENPSQMAPRTRGDGPTPDAHVGKTPLAAPRPRGWFGLAGGHRGPFGPAPAGMVPLSGGVPEQSGRRPRSRGDIPVAMMTGGRAPDLPAIHNWRMAGKSRMVHSHHATAGSRRGFPRTHGDGPGVPLDLTYRGQHFPVAHGDGPVSR